MHITYDQLFNTVFLYSYSFISVLFLYYNVLINFFLLMSNFRYLEYSVVKLFLLVVTIRNFWGTFWPLECRFELRPMTTPPPPPPTTHTHKHTNHFPFIFATKKILTYRLHYHWHSFHSQLTLSKSQFHLNESYTVSAHLSNLLLPPPQFPWCLHSFVLKST